MRRRVERLARAVAVAQKTWRLEQARLAQLETELSELRAAEAAALQALSFLPPKLILDHMASLSLRRLEIEAARADALIRARDHGRRVKLIEKLHAEALERWRREERRTEAQESQRPVSLFP